MPPVLSPDRQDPGFAPRHLVSSDRRNFLKWSGAAAALLAAGCANPTEPDIQDAAAGTALRTAGANEAVNLGSGDVGILNYAYALEQLEAEFYRKVVADFYPGSAPAERRILRDIRNHEAIHRDFFAAALGSKGIPRLRLDLSSVNFNNRLEVLKAAKAFEDLGVEAYNGAARLLKNTDYLFVAGKIVSVEARHASAIRDLINPKSPDFAPRAFDRAKTPPEVLEIAGPFFRNKIVADHLPTA